MKRLVASIYLTCLACTFAVFPAHAGPCTVDIAQFEEAMRKSADNPNAGVMAQQTVGAQVDRQPTSASMAEAQKRAQAAFARTLALAKQLDATGDRAGCTHALTAAKGMYTLQ